MTQLSNFYEDSITKLEQRVKELEDQIYLISGLTQSLYYNFSRNTLYSNFMYSLKRLKIKEYMLCVEKDNEWLITINNNENEQNIILRSEIIAFLLKTNKTTLIKDFDEFKDFRRFEYIIPIYHKSNALAFMFVGGMEATEPTKHYEMCAFVQTLTYVYIIGLENKRLFKANEVRDLIKKDIEMAIKIQNMLIPTEFSENQPVDIATVYKPNRKVGGDYYDFFHINEHEWIFCIADVSGKGIPAALLMSNFQASLRALANDSTDISSLVTKLNHFVFQNTKGERFITAFIGKINTIKHQLEYICAGHPPPIMLSKGDCLHLKQGTHILGAFDHLAHLNHGRVDLALNSLIFAYTDGVNEVESPTGDKFNEIDIINFLKSMPNDEMLTIINQRMLDRLTSFSGESDFSDDVTMLTMRYTHAGAH